MGVLRYRATIIARDMTPKKTGNLALNSLKDIPLEGEDFMLRWYGYVAPYNLFLESARFNPHIHDNYISRDIKGVLVGLVNSMQNGTFNEDSFSKRETRVNKLKPNQATNVTLLQAIGGVSLV